MSFNFLHCLASLEFPMPNYAPFVFAYLCIQWPIIVFDEKTLKINVNF